VVSAPSSPTGRFGAARARSLHIEQGLRARAGELGVSGWQAVALATVKSSSKDRVTTSAGSLSFHWFLAIFPAAIALTGVAGLVGLSGGDLSALVHGINVVLPASAAKVIDQSLLKPPARRAGIFEVVAGTVVALWSSVESMASLEVGLDMAFDVEKDRGFVARRLAALPLLGLTVLLGLVGFVLLVVGGPIGTLLHRDIPIAGGVFFVLWTIIRYLGAIAAVMLLISLFYAFGPNRKKVHFDWVSPGSALATIGWLAASVLFSVYLSDFGHEATSYGTFAGVAVLLLWLFLTGTAVLFGAELDRELERQRALRAAADPGVAGTLALGDRDKPSN